MSRHELDPRKDATLLAALGDLGQPRPGERSDADLLGGALAAFIDPRYAPIEPEWVPVATPDAERPSRAPVVIALAVAALAVAAAVTLVVLRPLALVGERANDSSGNLAPDVHDRESEAFQAVAGAKKKDRQREAPVPALAHDDPADASSPEPPSGECEEVAPCGTDGDLAIDDVASDTDDPGPTRPHRTRTQSPNEMLTHAQKLFGAGNTKQAVRVYEALVARHPSTAAGKAARVSLGRIELTRGRAKQALVHFDAYLAASAGSLVEEARYGRIRALRALGRQSQEQRSIAAFLADYPKSIYAARLQHRGAELQEP